MCCDTGEFLDLLKDSWIGHRRVGRHSMFARSPSDSSANHREKTRARRDKIHRRKNRNLFVQVRLWWPAPVQGLRGWFLPGNGLQIKASRPLQIQGGWMVAEIYSTSTSIEGHSTETLVGSLLRMCSRRDLLRQGSRISYWRVHYDDCILLQRYNYTVRLL